MSKLKKPRVTRIIFLPALISFPVTPLPFEERKPSKAAEDNSILLLRFAPGVGLVLPVGAGGVSMATAGALVIITVGIASSSAGVGVGVVEDPLFVNAPKKNAEEATKRRRIIAVVI